MMDAEDRRFIRQEIRRQLNIILAGAAGDNSDIETETIDAPFPGHPSITDRPVMHPYGLASRAPKGTISVSARHGADAHNRMVLGHRDDMRRQISLDEGETCIYGSDGKTVLSTIIVSNAKGIVIKTKFGSWSWNAISDMVFDTGTVQGLIGHGGHVQLKNKAGFDLIPEIIKAITTATAGGFPVLADVTSLETFVEP